jgi:hypothetical protein
MAEIKIMVDHEAEGIWCDEAIWLRIPSDFREKFYDWNWWWEIGESPKKRRGEKYGPEYDPDACAWIGLGLAMQLQQAMSDDKVIFVNEAEWDRAIAAALAAGHHDVPDSKFVYEIFVGPDRIEARRFRCKDN